MLDSRFRPLNLVLVLLGSLMAFTASPAHAIQSVEKSGPPGGAKFAYGISGHFTQGKGVFDRDLKLLKDLGVNSAREGLHWAAVETEKGKYTIPHDVEKHVDAMIDAGIEPIIVFVYGNPNYQGGDYPTEPESIQAHAKAAAFVAKHFEGRISTFEVQNEWLGRVGMKKFGKGKPDDYVRLLKATYQAIKRAAPGVQVVAPAMMGDSYLKGYLDQYLGMGLLDVTDVFSIHTYVFRHKDGRTPEAWAQWIQEMQQELRDHNDGEPVPMYLTEMGWATTPTGKGVTPKQEADYLARTYLLARTMPYVQGMWWYDFRDDGYNPESYYHNYGVVRPDGTPKPAYYTMRSVAKLVKNASDAERVDVGDPKVYLLKIFSDDDTQAWAVWSTHEKGTYELLLQSNRDEPEPMTLQQAGREPVSWQWGKRDWTRFDSRKRRLTIQETKNQTSITLTQTPTILRGDLDGVTIQGVEDHASNPAQ